MQQWRLANSRIIDTNTPVLMAILNCTPDSFYGESRLHSIDSAVESARAAQRAGAAILDVGGESTRPGSAPVDAAEQIRRTIPVIRAIRAESELSSLAISIDTTLAEVARAALDAGADAINDVSGLRDDTDKMLELLAATQTGSILMHRRVPPARDSYSDQYKQAPEYGDLVADVRTFFEQSLRTLTSRGLDPLSIVLDPGLGFGKSVEQNCELIRRTSEFESLARPILSGLSRKSFVGRLSFGRDSDPSERLEGTIALSVIHFLNGARIFRVHDVAACASALRAAAALSMPHLPPVSGIKEGETCSDPASRPVRSV
ncbi:MAG: dihydropteroate synthase [Phycisphaeraceae bacterium]|nr:dihydropteroate synthase [Phycisphaeraceae bacterium]